jgi:hypothetical protein
VFIGDCASFAGEIAGQRVEIASVYQDRSHKDPAAAKHEDLFAKMAKVETKFFKERKEQVIRLHGCPVSVAEQILALAKLGNLKNPFVDPAETGRFTSAYFSWRTQTAIARLRGTPYQRPGEAARGKAATNL